MINLSKIRAEIEGVCRSFPVKRLGLFGSAVTDSFSPDSDVDLLVTFDFTENVDFFDKYFSLKEELEKVFGREVDLVIDKRFKNQVFRDSVDKTKVIIYER